MSNTKTSKTGIIAGLALVILAVAAFVTLQDTGGQAEADQHQETQPGADMQDQSASLLSAEMIKAVLGSK